MLGLESGFPSSQLSSTTSCGYMERQEKHHSSASLVVVADPGVSHDSGTTYTLYTRTRSSSSRAQFSHTRSTACAAYPAGHTLVPSAGSHADALDG